MMRHLSNVFALAAACFAIQSNAAVLISDNFDAGRSSSINANGLEGWHTTGGSVDYVHQNLFKVCREQP